MPFADEAVLVYCVCDHPRHGHALVKRMIGRRRFGARPSDQREHCTMHAPDGLECRCSHFRELVAVPSEHGDGWRSMWTAPTTGPIEWVEVWNGVAVAAAHYAHDESGEEQPKFRGWYRRAGAGMLTDSYVQVYPDPTHWRPMPNA